MKESSTSSQGPIIRRRPGRSRRSESISGVRENAQRLSVGEDPIKPFHMVGRMGDQAVVVQQQGSEVVLNCTRKEPGCAGYCRAA